MASIKKGTPNLTWTLAQLGAWWAVKGKKEGSSEAIWDAKKCDYIYKTTFERTLLGSYDGIADDFDALPNCCGVGEFGNLRLEEDFTHAQLCALAVHQILSRKFKCLIATTARQPLEEKVLRAVGFKAVSTFVNPNSNNKVTLWHVTIK